MSLADQLKNPPPRRYAGQSRVDVWINKLPDDERASVFEAAMNPEWGHTALLDLLVAAGMPAMSATAFQAWRQKNGLPRPSAR